MLKKIRDFMDTEVCMVILVDSLEEFEVLAEVICSIGRDRIKYEAYKDDITDYMMEMRIPYNRYIAMMQGLRKRGYTMKPETMVDIFNRMVKL